MRISELRVANVLGIEAHSLDCGRITVLSGRNASLKTSILQGLQAGLGGGDLGKLKRVGSKGDPEVVLVLTDDDGHHYRVERKGKDTRIQEQVGRSAAYEDVRRPQTFLNSLYDAQLSNPLRFLLAPANTRADLLLEVLPIVLDREALANALGSEAWRIVGDLVSAALTKRLHPLEILAAARTAIYDERTGINRSYLDKRKSAEQLLRAIPADMPEAGNGALVRLERERDASADRIATARQQAEAAYVAAKQGADGEQQAVERRVKAAFRDRAATIRADHERQVSARLAQLEQAIAQLQKHADADVAHIREGQQTEIEALRATGERELDAAAEARDTARHAAEEARAAALAQIVTLEPEHEALVAQVSTLRSEQESVTKLHALKEQADTFAEEADSLHGMSDRLTAGLTALDAFKARLLEALPIDGLEVQGTDIAIHGVPFDQVNTAQQIKIAVQLATLRAKGQRLPVLFVDGAERLDPEAFGVLVQELEATGVQVFVSRVTDGDLSVQRNN